jgi:hypothetical protein
VLFCKTKQYIEREDGLLVVEKFSLNEKQKRRRRRRKGL